MLGSSRLRSPVVLGLLGALFTGLVFLSWLSRMPSATAPPPDRHHLPFARLFLQPDRPIEYLLNVGDGQSFAAIATDPTLSDPHLFASPAAAAYRAQRPVLGWLTFATSLGDRQVVPWSLAAWTVAGAGLLIGAAAWTAGVLGRQRWPALLLVGAPGLLSNAQWLGPECLATGLAVLGLGLWLRSPRRTVAAATCFVIAGLTRESLLLVPVALAAVELGRGRDWFREPEPTMAVTTGARDESGPTSGARLRRRLIALAAGPIAFGGWLLVVHARYGAWSWQDSEGKLGLPGVGLVQALPRMSVIDVAFAAVTLVVGAAAVLRRRLAIEVRAVVGAFLAFGLCMGPLVWVIWRGFGRPLLPLLAVGLVALAPTEHADVADEPAGADPSERPELGPVEAPVPVGAP